MEQTFEDFDLGWKDAHVKIVKKKTSNVNMSNNCNQCDYISSHGGNLRDHLRTLSGKKSNKCNQCDYISSHGGNLRVHLRTHSGEKSNKCNQCDSDNKPFENTFGNTLHYGAIPIKKLH